MKTIKLKKAWRNRVNATTVHEYPAHWSGVVSDEAAERAEKAGALDGAAVNAPEAPVKKAGESKS